MADAENARQRQRSASKGKAGGSGGTKADQATTDMDELQREYVSARAEYAKTVGEAVEALGRSSADAQAELVKTLDGLSSEVREGGEAAARAYPERLQRALANPDNAARCSEALQSYVDALRELSAAQGEAERSVRDAYQEYVTAVQAGEPDEEVSARGERARQAHLAALRASSPSGDLHDRASAARTTYEQLLRETQAAIVQEVTEAIRDYAGSTRALVDEREIPKRYEEAVRRYRGRIQEIAGGTQRTLLEANIRAVRELQAGWVTVGAAAGSTGSRASAGGIAGA